MVVVLPDEQSADGGWSTSNGAWIHVGADGLVTAFTGKVDVGQDNRTALSQLVAEELRVPFERVRLVMGDTDLCPYDMGTFGSRSMPDAGENLRATAASARELILSTVAKLWSVDADGLVASDGAVRERDGDRSITYGELLHGERRVERAADAARLAGDGMANSRYPGTQGDRGRDRDRRPAVPHGPLAPRDASRPRASVRRRSAPRCGRSMPPTRARYPT